MFTSIVTHEMITPLKCASQLAISINNSSSDRTSQKQAEVIVSTLWLIMSQIKLLLDKNLIDKKFFTPSYEHFKLNTTIKNTVNILNGQAELQKMTIRCKLVSPDLVVRLD